MMNYKEFGQGEPLIILHGLFGTLDNWQTLARSFGEHFTVFILDWRNHGKSAWQNTHRYSDLSNDLNEFMEAHWIHKAHILGHSMGGKAAMQFAADHTDKIDKLIIADIAPHAYTGGHESVFNALFAVDFTKITTRKEVEAILHHHINDIGTIQFLLKNLTRNEENSLLSWKMNVPVLYEYYPEILGNILISEPIKKQTLFLRGANSPYIQDKDWQNILHLFPNAQLNTIPNAGHWIHAEQPLAFANTVQDFLGNE
jgi:pimeloyl-ACP methyl ester carboxylesterase